jgi:ABC-2 type transport system ATP-binding protein
MASVEEICDHITLINKSKNILSGNVDDIRRKHGTGIFEVSFRGDREQLREALSRDYTILEGGYDESKSFNSLKLHLPADGDTRRLVADINDKVEIRSFSEIIPSMNDIFIKAVAGKLE